MTTVPSNLVPTRISQLTEYLGDSTEGYLPYVLNGITYKVQFGNIAAVGAVPSSRTITGGDGLAGGGDLSTNRVIYLADGGVTYDKLADSGVTAGTYGSASTIPVLDVDAKGRVTGATTVGINLSGYVPTSRAIIAGDGLTGGGTLTTDRTISLALTAAEPQPLGVPVAGSSTFAARDDHVHPAVNLTDTTETSGVLPMSRGGTGSNLTPAAGAILYTTGSETTLSNAGTSGQFFVSGGTAGPDWFGITAGSTGLSFGFSGSNYVLSGTVNIASGGTGATTAAGARVNLLPSYTGNGGKVLALNSGATDTEWIAISGAGTVTSVDVSGGSTGLTTSGGPITAAGTITIGGTLAPTSGGTGITSFAVGDLLFANTTTSLDTLHVGTNGYLLASNGTAPAYVNPTSVTIGTATNLAGGASGSIPYQSGSGTTTFLATSTGVLTASGGAPSYTMTPSLTQVTVAADPTTNLQVATKQYVDTLTAESITYHSPVKYEVPLINLNATYNNGTAGVGATLTNAGTLAAFTPDGTVASVGDRILVYNQTNAYENGVYTVTTVGSGSVAWVLTRATDANSYGAKNPNALGQGDAFFVTSGATGAGETYVMNTVGTITFGTTAINFVQISDTQIYSAGNGLTLTGTQFSLSGPVSIANGGTGQTTASAAFNALSPITTTGDLIVGNGSSSATRLAIGANGYILTSDGTTATWSAPPSSMVYPGAGIPLSAGSSWGTSFNNSGNPITVAYGGTGVTTSTGTGSVVLSDSPTLVTPTLGAASATSIAAALGAAATPSYTFTGDTDTGVFSPSANTVAVATVGSERMRVTSAGDVLIGTTTAGEKLTVAGSVRANSYLINTTQTFSYFGYLNGDARIQAYNSTGSGGVTNTLLFDTNNTERFRIGPSGQLGIGGANYGTSGQILTSNGSGSAPSWQAAPATGVTQAKATALSMILGF